MDVDSKLVLTTGEKPSPRKYPTGESPVPREKDTQCVGFDKLDQLALKTLTPDLLETADPHLSMTATALYQEGGRGPAARRLLSREVSTARARLRYFQALLNLNIKAYSEGKATDRRVKTLERLVAGEHRRLLSALELLMRMDASVSSIQVTANEAAVLVGG